MTIGHHVKAAGQKITHRLGMRNAWKLPLLFFFFAVRRKKSLDVNGLAGERSYKYGNFT
jgi:hypothetical protein